MGETSHRLFPILAKTSLHVRRDLPPVEKLFFRPSRVSFQLVRAPQFRKEERKRKKKHLQIFFPLIATHTHSFYLSENDTLRPDHLREQIDKTKYEMRSFLFHPCPQGARESFWGQMQHPFVLLFRFRAPNHLFAEEAMVGSGEREQTDGR